MDGKTQKERLEQELRFLKESFEAEVISREEFEKGKDRLEKKLVEIKSNEKERYKDESIQQSNQKQEHHETAEKDELLINKEGEKIKLKVIQDEDVNNEEGELLQITSESREKTQQASPEEPKSTPIQEPKKESRFFKYAVIFVILALVIFFYYSYNNSK